jgi:hypothetical protein
MKSFRLIEEKTPLTGVTPELEEADRVDYIVLIKQIVRVGGGRGGITLEEMEGGLRILKALDGKKLNDILELEDADWTRLCGYVKAYPWPIIDERLVRFAHTIINATEHVLDEPDGNATDAHQSQNGRDEPQRLRTSRRHNNHAVAGAN